MFQEYPKSLYMGGNPEAEHVIVRDAEEEAGKRELGFRMASEPAIQARDLSHLDPLREQVISPEIVARKKPGPKPKVQ
jgi:hypothetical protein